MFDFIERMSDAYIGKNTVKIDGSFFQFLRTYKKKIMKNVKMGELDKEKVEFWEKRMKSILSGLNQPFLNRSRRRFEIKKLKKTVTQFNITFKNVTIDAEEMDTAFLNDFVPPELRHLAQIFDKSL
jgi:hypothetical protein